ncbi:MAG: inositol monophosphatase [Burkholderiales bacterium]|nr:inositol monophosphatase [Burkholderiales bacterium]
MTAAAAAPITVEAIAARYRAAQQLAREAGEHASAYFRRLETLTVESKGTQDEVSIADRDTEAFIRARIAATFPDDGVLGEEGGDDRAGKRLVWVIDPIDGTACFVNAMYTWCVSIAVVVDGTPTIGAVYDPNAGELFHAVSGAYAAVSGGAWVNDRPARVKAVPDFRGGVLGVGFSHRSKPDEFTPFLHALLTNGGMFYRNGSGALMLCYVAAGRLIGYYEPHINSWDCVAAIAIIQAAGGRCNDFLAHDGMTRGNPIVAASHALYPTLVAATGKQIT